MLISIPERGSTPHLVGVCLNRIGTEGGSLEAKPDHTVEVFSVPGEGRECVEIARRVLSLARDGVAFDRIAVLLRSPEGYRAFLEEAFGRAGIPAHYTRGAVRPDPAGRAFYALLKCASDGLSARKFAEYLSLGQVPDATSRGEPPDAAPSGERWMPPDLEFSTDQAAEPPPPPGREVDASEGAPVQQGQLRAPRRWERLLVEAAVIGGRDRWRRRIQGLAKDLCLRISEVAEEDETQAAALARTLEDLASFAGYAIPLIDELDSLPKSATWGEWLDQLSALATRSLKLPDRVLAVLAELAPMGPLVFPIAGRGRPRKRHVPNVLSTSAEDMLTQAKWRMLAWRKGTKGPLKARFAAVRVRVADGQPQRIGDKGMQHILLLAGRAPLADEPNFVARQVLRLLHRPTARDDDLGRGQLRAV